MSAGTCIVYPVWVRGSVGLCAYMCVLDSSLFVALSVVRIRGMRVMMWEAVVFCARATLRLTPHSQPNVFLILSIPHHQSASSDSNRIHIKLTHKRVHILIHIYVISLLGLRFFSKHRACTHTAPHIQSLQSAYQDMHTHTWMF